MATFWTLVPHSLLSFGIYLFSSTAAFAWGATGHEWVSGIAAEKLPDSFPSFIRSPEALAEIAVIGRELDRSKGSGKTHDAERDPGHYVQAWEESAETPAVYPMVNAKDIESGKVRATREMFGAD